VRRFVCGGIALCLIPSMTVRAQTPPAPSPNPQNAAITDLKRKIFDAEMAQQTFAKGLKFCGELDGTNFYFALRDRVLNLEDYHRSLEHLARDGTFNPETRQPWTDQEAAARWEDAKREAVADKANCELVASLPQLEKKLEELEKNADTTKKTD
jgi:hypothetical protein